MKEIIFKGIEIAQEIQTQILNNIEPVIKEKEALATLNANRILDSVALQFSEKYGIQRLQNETKITDFIGRATIEIGERSLKLSEKTILEKENKIKELETKINSGSGDDLLKKEYESLKQNFGKLNDTLETEKNRIKEVENNYKSELYNYKFDNMIINSLPTIDDKANPFEVKERKNQAIAKIKENYELKQTESGEIILQNKTTFSTSKTLADLLTEELQPILVKNNSHGGAIPKNENTHSLNFAGLTGQQIEELITSNIFATTNIKSKIDARFSQLFKEKMEEGMKNLK